MPDLAIVAEPELDRWGDPIPGTGGTTPLRRIKVWPRASDEDETLYVGISAFIPRGKPVPTAAHTVLVGVEIRGGQVVDGTGKEYQVVGEPAELYRSGNGPLKGVIVNLDRRT